MAIAELNNMRFQDLDERVRGYIDHPLLRQHRIQPTVSRFHFDVLSAMLHEADLPPGQTQSILEAVLLLQLGLSIHDDVDEHDGQIRQLIVLTGDYSSGRYYWLLARVGDLRLLEALCHAVVRINEAKMALWDAKQAEGHEDGFDQLRRQMDLYCVVHGELLFAVCDWLFPDDSSWRTQVRSLVQAYIVSRETTTDLSGFLSTQPVRRWVSELVDNMLRGPINVRLQQTTNLLIECLLPVQRRLEQQSLAEGNR
ncbi:heptaprenyl diphosphate synthase component 1 [Alicyclobacillus herbarius]|uniref:heptaprenyl diphosphate synthase component 1 n=1 Tax=Alicyclobacillus herbarius TaxID=122960 RepID=UPI0004181932|nr:heptaprenyl diphosphate synthase component 1 [Alicyclobacillus herbarius]